MRNGEGKYVLMKKVIVHATTEKIKTTIRYTHLWHVCLARTNIQVKIYCDSLQFINWIVDYGATCHMTPEVSVFIPGSLEDTDKYIEVAGGHHVTAKQKGHVRIQMCDDNGKSFNGTLHVTY